MDEVALIYCRLGYFMLKHFRVFYFHVVNIFIAEHTHKILNKSVVFIEHYIMIDFCGHISFPVFVVYIFGFVHNKSVCSIARN